MELNIQSENIATRRTPFSQTLRVLNEQAKRQTFTLSDVDWSAPLDQGRNWMPETMVSISYLPSYEWLSQECRRRYNQLYALAVCEQFIWFEEDLLGGILEIILNRKLEPELRECLENFTAEERRHSAMFRRLLQKVDPVLGRKRNYHYFNLTPLQSRLFAGVSKWPMTALTWIWLIIYFEERTLHISRLYRQSSRGLGRIDATFCRVHELHMIDEARHLQIDQHLLKAFYDDQPKWKRALAGRMTQTVFGAYRSPRRIAHRLLNILGKEFLQERSTLNSLIEELPLLRQSAPFKEALFGIDALGRTRELLSGYPEMARALHSLTR